jgi:hypothetical protein
LGKPSPKNTLLGKENEGASDVVTSVAQELFVGLPFISCAPETTEQPAAAVPSSTDMPETTAWPAPPPPVSLHVECAPTLDAVWVSHGNVTYYFPSLSATLVVDVSLRTGQWQSIGTAVGEINQTVFTLYLNHGKLLGAGESGSYTFAIYPVSVMSLLKARALQSKVQDISKTHSMVSETETETTVMASSWESLNLEASVRAGLQEASMLTVTASGPSSVLLRISASQMSVRLASMDNNVSSVTALIMLQGCYGVGLACSCKNAANGPVTFVTMSNMFNSHVTCLTGIDGIDDSSFAGFSQTSSSDSDSASTSPSTEIVVGIAVFGSMLAVMAIAVGVALVWAFHRRRTYALARDSDV